MLQSTGSSSALIRYIGSGISNTGTRFIFNIPLGPLLPYPSSPDWFANPTECKMLTVIVENSLKHRGRKPFLTRLLPTVKGR
jgi:hypothetical protein